MVRSPSREARLLQFCPASHLHEISTDIFLAETNSFVNMQPPVDETALLQMWTSKLIWEAGLGLVKKGYAQQDD